MIYDGQHLHPSQFQRHRSTNHILGPCCLCPLNDEYAPDFLETVIHKKDTGPHAGKYVAECAGKKCRYLGESRAQSRFIVDSKAEQYSGQCDLISSISIKILRYKLIHVEV